MRLCFRSHTVIEDVIIQAQVSLLAGIIVWRIEGIVHEVIGAVTFHLSDCVI